MWLREEVAPFQERKCYLAGAEVHGKSLLLGLCGVGSEFPPLRQGT